VALFETIAVFVLLGVGLSQIYAGQSWLTFYQRLTDGGPRAIRTYGLGALALGVMIAKNHQIWSGPALVLTVLGWALVAEGLTCLAVPQFGLMGFRNLDAAAQHRAVTITGAVLVVMAGVLGAGLLWK